MDLSYFVDILKKQKFVKSLTMIQSCRPLLSFIRNLLKFCIIFAHSNLMRREYVEYQLLWSYQITDFCMKLLPLCP